VTEQELPPAAELPEGVQADAAALVIARELGIVEQTFGNWVRSEWIDRGFAKR